MTDERYNALMRALGSGFRLTAEELAAGWHLCPEMSYILIEKEFCPCAGKRKTLTRRGVFGWEAFDDSSYDGPGSPFGTGSTEADAIADLRERQEALRLKTPSPKGERKT